MQFFQEHLEYEADKGASLKHLQEHYAKFLQGVFIEESAKTPVEEEAETSETQPVSANDV